MYKTTLTKCLQYAGTQVINLVRFLGRPRFSSVPVDLHNSTDTDRDEQLVSGGYNDAFIIQFWTSYNPHRYN